MHRRGRIRKKIAARRYRVFEPGDENEERGEAQKEESKVAYTMRITQRVFGRVILVPPLANESEQ